MNVDELWRKAVNKTEILRARLRSLYTFDMTSLPYLYLAESAVNPGDVVMRKGRTIVEKPIIFLPDNFPQFEGFQVEENNIHLDNSNMARFLFMRGISFPTMKYSNETAKLDVIAGPLSKAIKSYKKDLERKEDINTGLIVAPEDCWQFAILIYVSVIVAKSIPEDIRNILKRMSIENN